MTGVDNFEAGGQTRRCVALAAVLPRGGSRRVSGDRCRDIGGAKKVDGTTRKL